MNVHDSINEGMKHVVFTTHRFYMFASCSFLSLPLLHICMHACMCVWRLHICVCVCVCVCVCACVCVCIWWGWGHTWPALLLFWFIRLVESIITESLHLLSFITPHLFSFYSQGRAEYITDFPWGPGASSSATGDNGMTGRDFWACFIIRRISIILDLKTLSQDYRYSGY